MTGALAVATTVVGLTGLVVAVAWRTLGRRIDEASRRGGRSW